MRGHRAQILEWAEQGAIAPADVDRALALAGVTPDARRWHAFLSGLLLWLGVLLLAAGVIFFFAFNWDALDRFAKFALIEGVLAAAVIAALIAGPDTVTGKAALFFAALLTGGLLALIGQTYQTGADPYELFAFWALLILPWTLVSRMPVFWLLLILLVNLAVALYFQASRSVFRSIPDLSEGVWALTLLNAVALIVWELASARGPAWLRPRWAPRIVAAASGASVTVLAVWAVFDQRSVGPLAFAAYAVWLAGTYWYYRYRLRDLFVLAGGILSAIVVVVALLSEHVLGYDACGYLLIGVIVIVMSALGAWWLKTLVAEEDAE